jgi:hypothetical protein
MPNAKCSVLSEAAQGGVDASPHCSAPPREQLLLKHNHEQSLNALGCAMHCNATHTMYLGNLGLHKGALHQHESQNEQD